jgi:zinc D-Ala-D-Ala carboxypeptidase
MYDIKIGKYFTLGEMIGYRTDNIPKEKELIKLTQLSVNLLDKIREKFGVVLINSGYRNFDYNKSVGGAKNSQHKLGEAADLRIKNDKISLKVVYEYIINNLEYDQIIYEKIYNAEWIHISYKIEGNRKENLLKIGNAGYTIYKNEFKADIEPFNTF